MKHRKLFPSLNSTNPTADCSDYCDPTTTETSFPDFYLPPPPPPPPPQSHQVSPYLILSASLLFCFLVLIIYYVVVHKSCFGWCRSRNRNERQLQSQSDDGDDEFLDENHHHPIWYIATVGLQQSIINSITICKYKKGDGLIEGTECAVCLNEFREDESLRLLPKCNHAFHISCIDRWLRSRVNCPMCRAQILCNNIIPTTSLNLGNSDLISETHEEDESEVNVGRNDENRGETENDENRGETEEDERGIILEESENCNRNSLVMLNSSSARTICVGLDDFGLVHDNDDDEDDISSCGGNSEIQDGDGNSNKVRGSSMAKCLHKSPILMKRSYSCSARFCSSKIKRNPNVILTL